MKKLNERKSTELRDKRSMRKQIYETQVIHDKSLVCKRRFFEKEAERYLLPVPPFNPEEDGDWEFAATEAHYQLKSEALAALRSAIRREKRGAARSLAILGSAWRGLCWLNDWTVAALKK